ncbi:protein-glutamine gamma-glutamyltransferase [Pseudogracilibacillus auburnensis]|uniref:protein-glutamine gamma-glutamyltransferase n=1 Tax=Pseudogracilibacillus auburnensis TaxID=1494959 RepID=UPI001A9746E7|nr:protein-glutamine gamma-glutamyltransferase [Pseudogracilibacillus auburnensis]MBO1005093.1 protein-glutamine gamma-glutamyltransferase [Pseudogracilibacillus auburnensis]
MIQLSGLSFQQGGEWPVDSIERIIIQKMREAPVVYSYDTIEELTFELKYRKNIIESARAMNQGHSRFVIFAYSRCNPKYWNRSNAGGFQLRGDVTPSAAILDIFRNSSLYAFECATAMMIIYYHGLLHSIDERLFNQLFQNIYLYGWHFDPDLGIQTVHSEQFLPGDIVYFKNPDVDPETPWWRGENAVVLGDGTFFGHGVGIMNAEQMIRILNKKRKPESLQSAYLKNSVTRPSFKHLAKLSMGQRNFSAHKIQHIIIHHNKNSISFERYLYYLNKVYSQMNYLKPFPKKG